MSASKINKPKMESEKDKKKIIVQTLNFKIKKQIKDLKILKKKLKYYSNLLDLNENLSLLNVSK